MNLTDQSRGTFSKLDELDLQKIAARLYRHLWVILAVSLCTGMLSILFTFKIQPRYQSTALIQVKSQSSNSNLLTTLGYKSGSGSAADTQLALLKTRYIIEPVVAQNNLNLIISSHYFPLFGEWVARHYQGEGVAKAFLGLNSYAWGGEKIEINKFIVPPAYIGSAFKLIAGSNNTYKLYSPEGKLTLVGTVGKLATNKYGLGLNLTYLKARPGTEFTVTSQSLSVISSSLMHDLQVTPIMGTDPTQNTNIAQLQLIDTDPIRVVKTLNAIVNYAVFKNAQQKSQETQKTLEFLNQRLPELRANLVKSEDALNQYHIRNKTLNMTVVSQLLVRELTSLNQEIERVKSQKEELLQIYTTEHPLVQAAENKESILEKKLAEVKAQITRFPLTRQEEINLLRDTRIKNRMYEYLLNNKQQLEVAKAGLTTDLIALTDATPAAGVSSHKSLLVLMGFFMGAFISIILILIRYAFTKTIESADQLEGLFQIPVQTVIPYSQKQKQLKKALQNGLSLLEKGVTAPFILAKRVPDDLAIESLRGLRISLHVRSPSPTHRVITLMGSTSNIGKSFIALNLSQVIANFGKRTLLIDADIRKGKLHESLLQAKSPGLSEYLENKYDYNDIIHPISDNLFFIPNGIYKLHPTELFQSARFKELLDKMKEEFDQIIIDTAPILLVTDSILIAQHSDIKLFVVSASKDKLNDVKEAIKKARVHNVDIDGIILNHRKPLLPYGIKYSPYSYGYGT